MVTIMMLVGVSILVAIHEFGHVLASKAVGFNLIEVSVGIGPKIFQIQWNEKYKLFFRLIPFAGYCLIKELNPSYADKNSSIRAINLKRIIVYLAGPAANFLFAFLLLIFSGNTNGLPISSIENSQLVEQGVTNDFVLRHINGNPVFSYNNVSLLLLDDNINTLSFRCYQTNTVVDVPIRIENNVVSGIVFNDNISTRAESAFVFMNVLLGFAGEFIRDIFFGDEQLFENAFANPYASFIEHELPLSYRATQFFMITSVFSFGMFFLNLMPFIIFDGYKILNAFVQLIRNKQNSRRISNIMIVVGIILSVLMVI